MQRLIVLILTLSFVLNTTLAANATPDTAIAVLRIVSNGEQISYILSYAGEASESVTVEWNDVVKTVLYTEPTPFEILKKSDTYPTAFSIKVDGCAIPITVLAGVVPDLEHVIYIPLLFR